MQANSITLAVDELNNATDVNHVYSRFDVSQNRSTYIHSGHTPLDRDTMSFFRGTPQSNGNFKGVAKTSAKFSQDIEVEGVDETTTLKAPIILEVSFSIPLGATDAEVLIARQRAIALLDDDTVMVNLNTQMMI